MPALGKDGFEGLLPSSFDEFRSLQFWDKFFVTRGQEPFEWYGEWRQLRPLMLPVVRAAASILVIGCGNSNLSADM